MHGLDDMYVFKCVMDCGGVSAAGRRLSVPKSTIARRLADLEKRLGVPLFHRGSRTFAPTNFGTECYESCAKMALEADKILAMADRSRQKPAGLLHVICPPVLGSTWVEALAAEFAAAAPDVRLHLEETVGVFDPRAAQADLIVYPSFGPLHDAAIVARKIFTSPYMLVANPELFKSRTMPPDPQSLKMIKCAGLGSRGSDWAWVLRRGREVAKFCFEPSFSTTSLSALLEAARRGLGVASLPTLLCEDDLSTGRLIRVLEDWSPQPVSVFAIYPSHRALSVAARQFLDLLVERSLARSDAPRATWRP